MRRRLPGHFMFRLFMLLWLSLSSISIASALDDGESKSLLPDEDSEGQVVESNHPVDDFRLILVNRDHPLDSEMYLDFAYTYEGLPIHSLIYQDYLDLIVAGWQAGHSFTVISGYRSMDLQGNIRDNQMQSYLNQGYSYEEAQYWTDLFLAPMDASEHTTGLAIDILGDDWTSIGGGLTVDYAYQASADWLAHHAHEFGFILRYPEGKSHITGYHFEPWHFRYVGRDHAKYMYDHDLVLEEYLGLIKEKH